MALELDAVQTFKQAHELRSPIEFNVILFIHSYITSNPNIVEDPSTPY